MKLTVIENKHSCTDERLLELAWQASPTPQQAVDKFTPQQDARRRIVFYDDGKVRYCYDPLQGVVMELYSSMMLEWSKLATGVSWTVQ